MVDLIVDDNEDQNIRNNFISCLHESVDVIKGVTRFDLHNSNDEEREFDREYCAYVLVITLPLSVILPFAGKSCGGLLFTCSLSCLLAVSPIAVLNICNHAYYCFNRNKYKIVNL